MLFKVLVVGGDPSISNKHVISVAKIVRITLLLRLTFATEKSQSFQWAGEVF
ncbi:hypothetical protein CES85_3391 (plasmid) [Ochrobactrum quorumnocens]|uniref:Uncharacterized protein n=1 Tax=Ochrobactrum quorumnocens TaxID=271865 RepID=A0A248UNX1_9HYPH|nr:hypothetical protein CES85_3391 [[Ochrobactrum] quorumnocens]